MIFGKGNSKLLFWLGAFRLFRYLTFLPLDLNFTEVLNFLDFVLNFRFNILQHENDLREIKIKVSSSSQDSFPGFMLHDLG